MKTIEEVKSLLEEGVRRKRFELDEVRRKYGEDSHDFMYAKGWFEAASCYLGIIDPGNNELDY